MVFLWSKVFLFLLYLEYFISVWVFFCFRQRSVFLNLLYLLVFFFIQFLLSGFELYFKVFLYKLYLYGICFKEIKFVFRLNVFLKRLFFFLMGVWFLKIMYGFVCLFGFLWFFFIWLLVFYIFRKEYMKYILSIFLLCCRMGSINFLAQGCFFSLRFSFLVLKFLV